MRTTGLSSESPLLMPHSSHLSNGDLTHAEGTVSLLELRGYKHELDIAGSIANVSAWFRALRVRFKSDMSNQ